MKHPIELKTYICSTIIILASLCFIWQAIALKPTKEYKDDINVTTYIPSSSHFHYQYTTSQKHIVMSTKHTKSNTIKYQRIGKHYYMKNDVLLTYSALVILRLMLLIFVIGIVLLYLKGL